ncbi:MAG TPA: hypothetical protein VGH20_12095 [Myxococcales bacterium]|jgi:hypothetical protein
MKIAGLDWVGFVAEACVENGKAAASKSFIAPAPVAALCDVEARDEVRPLSVRGAMSEGDSSVELYLTEDGTLIRLENANQCEPLRYACLLE